MSQKPPKVSPEVAAFFAEEPAMRFNAILFRGRIYVSCPRHMDAIHLAFSGMTRQQQRRVSTRIEDGKEKMLFGTTLGDGSDWEWDEKYQGARMTMYGFA